MIRLTRKQLPTTRCMDESVFGVLRIGPIRADRIEVLCERLRDLGLKIGTGRYPRFRVDAVGPVEAEMSVIDISGKGVLGYLLELDGLEAATDLLCNAFTEVLEPLEMTTLDGVHWRDGGAMVTTRIDLMSEPDRVIACRSQTVGMPTIEPRTPGMTPRIPGG